MMGGSYKELCVEKYAVLVWLMIGWSRDLVVDDSF